MLQRLLHGARKLRATASVFMCPVSLQALFYGLTLPRSVFNH